MSPAARRQSRRVPAPTITRRMDCRARVDILSRAELVGTGSNRKSVVRGLSGPDLIGRFVPRRGSRQGQGRCTSYRPGGIEGRKERLGGAPRGGGREIPRGKGRGSFGSVFGTQLKSISTSCRQNCRWSNLPACINPSTSSRHTCARASELK